MSKTLSSLVVSSIATTTVPGGVKIDGSTITISNGVISSNVPTASTTTLGGVKVDGTSVTIANGVITSSPRLTFSSTGASYIPLNTSVVKWYAYENDLLPISTTVDGTSARTISYNNVGASPVGGSLNLTTVGDLAKSASFIVTNTNTLGTVATNTVGLDEIRGVTGTNTIKNNTFTVRKNTGSDWTTAALHDSIGVDNLYLTPGTDTKCFWERHPYNETHIFGSSSKTYLTLSPTGTIVNGSLTANTLLLTNITEVATVVASAAPSTIQYYISSQTILYYTTAATANWTVNLTYSASVPLSSMLSVGQAITMVCLVTQGTTAYYNNTIQIDGTTITPKWQGGTAPSSGNTSSIDSYAYTIIKTAASPVTYTVIASQTKFA